MSELLRNLTHCDGGILDGISFSNGRGATGRLFTHSSIATPSQNFKTAIGSQRLRASDDALGAVHNTAPRGEFEEGGRSRRVDG